MWPWNCSYSFGTSNTKVWQKNEKVKVKVKSRLTLCDLMDYSPPGSSVHGIFQARILEWVAISFSRESSQPRDRTQVSCIAGGCFNLWATREAPKISRDSMYMPVTMLISTNCYKLHLIFVTTRTLNPHYSNYQLYFMDEKLRLLTNLQKWWNHCMKWT